MNIDMKITVKSNIDEYRALLKKLSAAAKKVDDILGQINAMELELKYVDEESVVEEAVE